MKLILHLVRGVSFSSLFSAKSKVENNTVILKGAAIFSNFIKVKKQLISLGYTENVTLDLTDCKLVDHSVIETLHHLKDDFHLEGGSLTIKGIGQFKNVGNSTHHLAARRRK